MVKNRNLPEPLKIKNIVFDHNLFLPPIKVNPIDVISQSLQDGPVIFHIKLNLSGCSDSHPHVSLLGGLKIGISGGDDGKHSIGEKGYQGGKD